MNCNICSRPTTSFARAILLRKFEVQYYRCGHCGFIQPETPYWLSESYADAISDLDLGTASRALENWRAVRPLILSSYDCNAKFVDYGGGYGLFVRMMRDSGFDFYRYDTYCENILAKGLDAEPDRHGQYELATAFEVFEHFVDPLKDVSEVLAYSRNIYFSTLLVPDPAPKPGEWWYYVLDHGQHVALYSRESLEFLAAKLGLRLYTNGTSHHLLTEKKLPLSVVKRVTNSRYSKVMAYMQRRKLNKPSLLMDDMERAGQHLKV